jgi:hypothetical protein
MTRPPRGPRAPADGVSPELLELALRYLRKRYGDRPLDHVLTYDIQYHLAAHQAGPGRGEGEARAVIDLFPTKNLPDGREITVLPLLHGMGRLCVGAAGEQWFDGIWDYDTFEAAVAAMHAWDGAGEPAGWSRHPDTGRRRPGGDPGKEYVHK